MCGVAGVSSRGLVLQESRGGGVDAAGFALAFAFAGDVAEVGAGLVGQGGQALDDVGMAGGEVGGIIDAIAVVCKCYAWRTGWGRLVVLHIFCVPVSPKGEEMHRFREKRLV